MKEELGIIRKNEEISPGIFDMRIETEEIAERALPGQFVSVYTSDDSRLLPRPVSICGKEGKELRLVYRIAGKGTASFSKMGEGAAIRLVGPLGNGFPIDGNLSGQRVVLFGGGIGIAPMLFAAEGCAKAGADVRTILGYRDQHTFLAGEFSSFGEVLIATEDGSAGVKGTVLDAFASDGGETDLIFSCGPVPMQQAIQREAQGKGIPCFLSLEERMACAIGACLGCVVKTKKTDTHSHVNNARVCKDGPVFSASEIEF